MIYLNIILTLIFLVLLSFLVLIVLIIKKYGKNVSNLSQISKQVSSNAIPFDNKQMEESMKMLNSIFGKNFMKQ